MRIAVTSQNFRTITGHAGKTRRFLIFSTQEDGAIIESDRLDLPKALSLHEYHGDDHPLFSVDAVITGSCGEGFVRRLARHGIRVIATAATDPATAAAAVAAGESLPAPASHEH